MEAVPANCLRDVRNLALKACVIGIDEGQFVSTFTDSMVNINSVELCVVLTYCLLYYCSFQIQWNFVRRWPI